MKQLIFHYITYWQTIALISLLACTACSSSPENLQTKVTKPAFSECTPIHLPYYINEKQLLQLSQFPVLTTAETAIFSAENKQAVLYAIGKIQLKNATTAVLYGFLKNDNPFINIALIDVQHRLLNTYQVAYKTAYKTKVAQISEQQLIKTALKSYVYNNETNQYSFTDSTLIQYYTLGEPIFDIPIDTIAQQDINQDNVNDSLFIIPPIINIPYAENPDFYICIPSPCQTVVKSSLQTVPPIFVPTHHKIHIKNIGDIDGNHYTDLLVTAAYQWNTYQTAYLYAYNLKNTHTWQLIDSIQTYNSPNVAIQVRKIDKNEVWLTAPIFDPQTGLFTKSTKKINFRTDN